jgi:hypothetical protein
MKEGPPLQLAHLFRDTQSSSADILRFRNQNLVIMGVLEALEEEEVKSADENGS